MKDSKGVQLRPMRMFVISILSLLLVSQPVIGSLIGDQIFCSFQDLVETTPTGVEDNFWDPAINPDVTNLQQPHPIVGAGIECSAVNIGSADFSEVDGRTLLTFSTPHPGNFLVRFTSLDFGPGEILSDFKLIGQSSNVEHPLTPLIIDEENPHQLLSASGIYIFSPGDIAPTPPPLVCPEPDPNDCPPPPPPFVHTFELVIDVPPLPVEIDIKPGSDPNCFNINGHGVVPIAILGSDTFDPGLIDTSTLLLGGLEVRVRGKKGPMCGLEYSNGDNYLDLVCQFEDSSDNWSQGSGEATVTGELFDGSSIEGTDSICVVP